MRADATDVPGDEENAAPDWPVQPDGRPTRLSLSGGMGMMLRLLLGVLVSGLVGLVSGLLYGARVARRAVAVLPPGRAADEIAVWSSWTAALLVHGAIGLLSGAALGVVIMLAWTFAGGGWRARMPAGRSAG